MQNEENVYIRHANGTTENTGGRPHNP